MLLVIYDVQRLFDIDKTNEAVAAIHAQKITLADVQGTNLPPIPDQAENDATVAGVDKNNNGIRDDVELAIFKKYPSDKKARGAALQYAMTEQMYLTRVYNTETWKAVAEEGDRAYRCIFESLDQENLSLALKQTTTKTKEVEILVFNTTERRESKERAFDFTTSYGNPGRDSCDVEIDNI